jgi:hypothetical protein
MVDDADGDPGVAKPVREHAVLKRASRAARARLDPVKKRLAGLRARYEHLPVADVMLRIYRRDREAGGSVVGSAIAFRLFLFFVPLLLFFVGVAGFASVWVSGRDVASAAGVSGASKVRSGLPSANPVRLDGSRPSLVWSGWP